MISSSSGWGDIPGVRGRSCSCGSPAALLANSLLEKQLLRGQDLDIYLKCNLGGFAAAVWGLACSRDRSGNGSFPKLRGERSSPGESSARRDWGWGLPVSVPFPISLLSAPAPPAFLPLHFWESGNLLLPKAPAGIVPEHLQALTEVFALCPN